MGTNVNNNNNIRITQLGILQKKLLQNEILELKHKATLYELGFNCITSLLKDFATHSEQTALSTSNGGTFNFQSVALQKITDVMTHIDNVVKTNLPSPLPGNATASTTTTTTPTTTSTRPEPEGLQSTPILNKQNISFCDSPGGQSSSPPVQLVVHPPTNTLPNQCTHQCNQHVSTLSIQKYEKIPTTRSMCCECPTCPRLPISIPVAVATNVITNHVHAPATATVMPVPIPILDENNGTQIPNNEDRNSNSTLNGNGNISKRIAISETKTDGRNKKRRIQLAVGVTTETEADTLQRKITAQLHAPTITNRRQQVEQYKIMKNAYRSGNDCQSKTGANELTNSMLLEEAVNPKSNTKVEVRKGKQQQLNRSFDSGTNQSIGDIEVMVLSSDEENDDTINGSSKFATRVSTASPQK